MMTEEQIKQRQATAGRFAAARSKKGLSVRDVARALNLSTQYIYQVESGETGCSVDRLSDFAKLYSVSTDYLLGRKGTR